MREVCQFLGGNARVIRDETILDLIRDISKHTSSDEPFFVLNASDIFQKVKTWRLKLPRVKMFYAVKCNGNKTVLEMLAALGVGFDCASKNEMQRVVSMGVDPSRIIFAHPCKPISHFKCADKLGIDLMTFDNEVELHKTKTIMPNARLLLRIKCEALKAQAPLGVKFGVDPKDALPLLVTARKLGLNIAGVAFHVGSGCQEPQVFERAIRQSREIFEEALALGFKPYILDIGGGFPGVTGSLLDVSAHIINDALDKYFPVDSGVEIMAEPGRFVVASAFTLATNVVSKRQVYENDGSFKSTMYYINDGVYGSFNCILYDHQEVSPIPLKDPTDENAVMPCSVWGPTCDGLDKVLDDAFLPPLELGDWIAWPDMGAYTLAAAGNFNGFPIPRVHVAVPLHTVMHFEDLQKMTSNQFNFPDDNNSFGDQNTFGYVPCPAN